MQLAHERGIGVTAGIWDHIYRGGVQTGGIPDAPKGPDERARPGLGRHWGESRILHQSGPAPFPPGRPMRWPQETSRWFTEISDAITTEVEQAERAAGERTSKEFRSSVTDFRMLAALARYYSWQLQAAVAYNVYKESGDLRAFNTALDNEKRAIDAWRAIVDAADGVYADQLPFGAPGHFPRHWREELQRLNADFEGLVAALKTAPAKLKAQSVASARLPAEGAPPLAVSPATASRVLARTAMSLRRSRPPRGRNGCACAIGI
jgi:hypothetical protein